MKITRKQALIYFAVLAVWCILGFVPVWLQTDVKMFGVDGLQSLILHIVIDEFRALLLSGYILFSYLSDLIKGKRETGKTKNIIFLIVLPVLVYLLSGKPSLNEQYRIKNINLPFPDIVMAVECAKDLNTDEYDESLVNGCILGKTEHSQIIFIRNRTEYTADFTYNGQPVVSAQIGYYQYKLLEEVMPINSDTVVKIYRNSGFVRNVTPVENL